MAESTSPAKHPNYFNTEFPWVSEPALKGKEEQEEYNSTDPTICRIASRVSRHTVASEVATPFDNIFRPVPGSKLDPKSSSFESRAWVEALVRYESKEVELGRRRKSGVSFRNLDVYGFGMSTNYQKSVGNIILSLVTPRRKRRINILYDFEGLIDAGETLLVLGPPGSGCSTLLRTIAGQMKGLFLGDKVEMNYRGMYGQHYCSITLEFCKCLLICAFAVRHL